MEWLDEVKAKLARKNQVLFSKSSAYLQDLQALLDEQDHRTVILWALAFADETAKTLRERYPQEGRPEAAVATARAWAAGRAKMPEAQRAILQAHAVAKELDSPEDIALCHAVGQACGTVHTAGHAMGYPIYELTALVRRYGVEGCAEPIARRKAQYLERLGHWRENCQSQPRAWADFLKAD